MSQVPRRAVLVAAHRFPLSPLWGADGWPRPLAHPRPHKAAIEGLQVIEPARWRQLRDEPGIWPDDIRWMREAFLKDWQRWAAKDQAIAGRAASYGELALTTSPRFFVAKDGQLLESAPAAVGWQSYIAPPLKKLVGE